MCPRAAWIAAGLLMLLSAGTPGARAGAAQGPAVIELFTSEGCSDCPPADALLGKLARLPGVIALAYHVTYWNALGWRDRFELPQADRRQQRYVDQLGLPSAFTPQAIIDGRLSFIGSDGASIRTALRTAHTSIPVRLRVAGGRLRIGLNARSLGAPLSVLLVAYRLRARTLVRRGENAGRQLEEYNIVRATDALGVWHGRPRHFAVALASLPATASRVAVLLQRLPQGAIVGAAALAVPPPAPAARRETGRRAPLARLKGAAESPARA